ncbi:uncharacterized protein TRIVIDRAFT_68553 [Trichoderma virens Gv29-8]|uniref:Uncharacterized protein n=1 Tax=Hypocrea virens (strain Gv29-8 / FGSC 10586) TaxID=413071 RepID=G9MZB2_HYPVG|nr:uncharacterized protein TRIVIDRAFT_68553 [Trichoderma virens Gv29-8]EHK19969.1 hypothetical protein TRIVIDRAFT_68553 [Trichoderma virens Gv29-8]UKZ46082.1 hypothetical protein TrVGV298_000279 [Trichoderma virens]
MPNDIGLVLYENAIGQLNPLGQTGLRYNYTRPRTDAPMLFSGFKYNVQSWPRALAETVANLVLYRTSHKRSPIGIQVIGGHFASSEGEPDKPKKSRVWPNSK